MLRGRTPNQEERIYDCIPVGDDRIFFPPIVLDIDETWRMETTHFWASESWDRPSYIWKFTSMDTQVVGGCIDEPR